MVTAWLTLTLAPALLLVWHLTVARQIAGEIGLPLDDGWIHARFAQNLARGQGFSFNPGEPTSTTTSPLWTALLALGFRITGEPIFTGIAINYVLCLALLVVVYRLSLALTSNRWPSLCAAAAVALTPPLGWWALSGMEPPLYAVLALLGILLHISARGRNPMRDMLAAPVFGLAALVRPEMMLLFPLAIADRLISTREQPLGRRLQAVAIALPIYLLVVLPFFTYNHRVTGYYLPTSFYSKLQWSGLPGLLAGALVTPFQAILIYPLREIVEVFRVWFTDNCILAIMMFVGFGWMIARWSRKSDTPIATGSAQRSLLIPMLLVVQPLAWALASGYRPPSYQSQRYIADLNPLFVLLGVIGGWFITERIAFLRRPVMKGALLALVLAASLIRQSASVQTYATNVKNTNDMQVTIGRWLKANAPPDSLLAVNDIGAIGYISDMRVLDLQGLVTPEVLPLRSMQRQLDRTAPARMFDFIVSHRPDYLVIFPRWYPELDARRDLFTPVYVVELKDNITNGSNVMIVYRTIWAGRGEVSGHEDR